MNIQGIRQTRWYRIILLLVLVGLLFLLWQLSGRILLTTKAVSSEDHWRFWTAWRLTLIGENPYDVQNLTRFHEDIPWLKEQPSFLPVILNPPWAILLLTPYAPFSYPVSRLLWLVTSISLLLISSNLIWRLYCGRRDLSWIAWLATFVFYPTILVLKQAQLDPWILLGLIGFLYFTSYRRNDWLAGFSLAICTIKPQILLVFWFAVLWWVIRERRWKVVVGGLLVILPASLIMTTANPSIFQQFMDTYLVETPVEWMTPTIGFYLRLIFGPEKFWLQFIPPMLGLLWFGWYAWGIRSVWNWLNILPPVLWACILASPYSWTYDQVILLIPLLAVISSIVKDGLTKRAGLWLGTYLLINLAALGIGRYFTEEYFIWLAPVLLLWYWLARRSLRPGLPADAV
jgi:hypothetical protein